MQRLRWVTFSVVGGFFVIGCRTAIRVAEVPRVDLELQGGGNRGYLVGTPPEAAAVKTTRQLVETTVEVPSFYKPKHTGAPVDLGQGGQLDTSLTEGTSTVDSGPYDTYVVQKGESLWSIAAKPEIYGKATAWRRIFDANRNLLKSPDRVRPGMTLNIPRGNSRMTTEDEGTTYKK